MIVREFLNGDSLKGIKEKLEKASIPSPARESKWTTQTILRILQNEKYAGDVLLQKTYTSDFLEGKVKKNNGELPQYYIKDNHPAIIPREMFFEIQEELARRRSKKPANTKKAKTNRGRFTSKYALSERLVCGDCGCYFRRVTWNIHGRKQIVWRCINRLEFGPKSCGNSPSLEESALHTAILEAIRSLVHGQQEELAAALQDACEHWAQNAAAKRALAADFCRTLRQGWPAARFHSTADGLPGLVSVGLPGQDSQNMTYRLDLAGVCVSPGAACDNTGRTHPSHVLLALGGQAAEDALCTLRFSFGAANAPGDGAEAARRLLNLLHTD